MDGFEYLGEWWDIQDPSHRWSGTLSFDPVEGAILTVTDPTRTGGFFGKLREYDAVLGETTSGKDVSLIRCFDRSLGGALGKPGSREIFAHAVLVGFHGEGRDPVVSAANVVFRHAAAWWGQSGISLDHSVRWPGASVHYRRPATVQVFSDGDLEIKIYATLASLPSGPDSTGEFRLREEVRVELQLQTPRPLSFVLEIVHACQDLLSIACRHYCAIERLAVFQTVDPFPNEATYHAVPVVKPSGAARNPLPSSLLFKFQDIQDEAVFGSWLAQAEALRPVRALYFLAIYGQTFIEGRFLALVQAVEAFHRRCRSGVYMDPAAFAMAVEAPLVRAIPADLDDSLRDALATRIKFGNEYSLRKRLRLLFEEHRTALDKVVPQATCFIDPMVARRNAFTHFPPAATGARIDAEEWLRYNFLLRVLLDFCFLKTMGFSDEKVTRLAEQCDDYRQWAERLFGRWP
jgi:hypothetical protein